RLVQQQEESAGAADPVVLVGEIQARLRDTCLDEVAAPLPCAFDQLIERAELDRVGGAGLRARRLHPVLQPVVAERALVHAAVSAELSLSDEAEGTGGNAVAAAVADVVLDDDGAEFGAENRPRRADVEAAGVGAVLADVRF